MKKMFCRVALIFIVALVGVEVRAQASDAIWQLDFQNGHPVNCTLAFTRVDRGDQGRPILVADTRGNKIDWHSCITLPKGLLKAGKDYLVTLDYQVIEKSSADTYFYVFGRSDQLGLGADHWQTWHGEPGARGEAKLRISPSANDYVINVGIHNQGACCFQSQARSCWHGADYSVCNRCNIGILYP
jgi:hypothetical protein